MNQYLHKIALPKTGCWLFLYKDFLMPKPQPTPTTIPRTGQEQYEQDHVHEVYQQIASHFSETRYKPWPIVERFLLQLPLGSIGTDVGCGNGKYIGVNKNVVIIGSDRSLNLVSFAKLRGHEVLVCDGLETPFRSASFDFAISIAVIHHFSTSERRQAAIKELLRIVRPSSPILIFVWALEQSGFSKRHFDPEKQDIFVPWVLKSSDTKEEKVYQRYYHLFARGELEELVLSTKEADIVESGYDQGNWYVITKKK